jgi:hypothetical protein
MEKTCKNLFVSRGVTGILILLIILFSVTVYPQKPVKTDLIPYFENVLVPPQLCKDAFNKGICLTDNGAVQCDSKKLFDELKTKLDGITKEINSVPAYTSMDDKSKIADEINKKGGADKIKNMSKEEKMKMAMDMMKNMNVPQTQLESEEVKDTFAKESELNQFTSAQVQELMNNYKIKADHDKQVEDKHTWIDDWERSEIAKLPQISTGEMSEPDPKEVKRVKLEAADKHIKVADEELKYISGKWAELKDNYKQHAIPFCQSLAKSKYGDAAQNKSWVNLFGTGQTLVVNMISDLLIQSANAYNYGARYFAERVRIEKEEIN